MIPRKFWMPLFAAAMLVVPVLPVPEFWITQLNYIGLYAIVSLGLVLLTGVAGLTSFGQAAFVGVGAYTSAYLSVILTVFLALGAWRISKRQVLTRRVTAVEALGAITVLAVDKTGTLTQNRMAVVEVSTVKDVFPPEGAHDMPEDFHRLVEFAMLATPGDPFDPMAW